MGKENKSYRIRTNVNSDSVVSFNVNNTVDSFDILSLKIDQKNTYRLMGSNTGIVVGRVLANGGFGVPNVKVSIFIPYEDTENISQRILYHYNSTKDYNDNGIRYNLLPNELDDECHQNIGTFPSKRVLLDNNNWIDVFDKYYKFTTRTNNAGDYMIYGVPTGNQTVHMDVDLSDIGILSQKPRDLIYKGYNANMFENMTKFKVDTNIDSLAQVITQDQTIYVYPFWGDTSDSELNASITRCDMNINYKFEPTCIFMGSVITDTGENAMSKGCIGAKKQGKMSEMITGDGRIEMIRKTPNGQVEQFSVKGDNNINSDGVWCYQIPMNLDYVKTDEFGKMVMTDDPNTGLPTRARVRFRLSMAESPSDATARKRARFLIPNNPHFIEEDYPSFCETKEIDYEFGTKTKNENFRDLFWNNVYTVKSYIPRIQESRLPNNLRHLGIKMVNHSGSNNPMPFNNLRIKFNFIYSFLCVLIKVLVTIVGFINTILTFIGNIFLNIGYAFFNLSKEINFSILGHYYFDGVAKLFAKYKGHGIKDSDDLSPKTYLKKVWEDRINGTNVTGGLAQWFLNIFLAIGCGIELKGLCETDDGVEVNVTPGTYDKVKDALREAGIATCNDRVDILYNCIENQLAQDNEVTSFDFYNDWVNGVVYLPLWYRSIKKRRGRVIEDQWCSTDNTIIHNRKYKKSLRLYATNVIKRVISSPGAKTMGKIAPLVNNEYTAKAIANNETGIEILAFTKHDNDNCYGYNCHKYSRTYFKLYKGLIFEKETMVGDKVYYYKPCDYDQTTGNSDLVTLFATDLVLLGSLNDCDMHGIPQFFKALENTTYNMPPDLMSEKYDYINEDSQTKPDTDDNQEIDLGSRMTEYTGADWGNLGVDQSNYNEAVIQILGSTYYKDANENEYDNGGLFYGLTCFNSYTKPKSCINLSRICELGVSLDESIVLSSNGESSTGTESNSTPLTPDGFISYDEIYNSDYRSIFATLNANFLRTKLNPETGLLEYDFNHLYLDNFDGSLKLLMMAKTVNGKTEKSDFQEKANYVGNYNLEISSDAYLNFRYGNYVKRNGNKIYFYENNNTVGFAINDKNGFVRINGKNRLPRYENSFYFYFGLNEGKTALDKFNTEFFSDCTNKFASDVPYDLTYRGNSWCPMDSTDGFIAFNMNIEAPYSVMFTNKDTNDVYYQTSINKEKFIFHQLTPEQPIPEGYEKYTIYNLNHNNDLGGIETVDILPIGTYSVLVTDAYDNEYEDSLTFELPRVGFLCDVNPFSARNIELVERFKYSNTDTIKDIYTHIADYGQFSDIEELKYTAYKKDEIITAGTIYYTKDSNNIYHQSTATTQTIVPQDNYWYFKHNPRLNRDINGYIGVSEVTEYDFRIKLEPINTLFFGDNYNGMCFDVHYTFTQMPVGQTIDTDDIYYTIENGEYIKNVNTGAQITVSSDDEFYSAMITVLNHEYFLYSTGDVITDGTIYYIKDTNNNYVPQTQSGGSYVVENDDEFYYHVDNCGYLGFYTFEGVTNFFIGVPYGNERYKLTIRQLCDDNGNWMESNNITSINIVVYEDEFKMFINDIDYDLIANFNTGWVDENLLNDGEFVKDNTTPVQHSYYDYTKIYGWNDVLNIGSYNNGGTQYDIKQIGYDLNNSESNIRTNMKKLVALSRAISSSYNHNGIQDAYDQYLVGDRITVGTTYYVWDNTTSQYIPDTSLTLPHTIVDGEEYYYKANTSPYLWSGEYVYDVPYQEPEDYYLGTIAKIDYTYTIPYRFTINDNIILYDYFGNIIEENDMSFGATYYKDDEHNQVATGGAYDPATYENYDYTWMNWLYDSIGTVINASQIIRGEIYYNDPQATVVAVIGETYMEHETQTDVNVIRKNNKTTYKELNWNDYLFSGDTFYYRHSGNYIESTVIPGYENGITVRHYSNLMYQGATLYYKLEELEYGAQYAEYTSQTTILATENNDGDITYTGSAGNVEYTDLNCLTLFNYREIVDNINKTINHREVLVREFAAAFRINDDETTLNLTTKTKAKPVKYLIAGSNEITASDLLFNYKPRRITPVAGTVLMPVKYERMSQIENTTYKSLTVEKEISDGYVVDRNLETPSVVFALPTLTVGSWYSEFQSTERVKNGDKYYLLVNGQYKPMSFIITETVGSYKTTIDVYHLYETDETIPANTVYYTWNSSTNQYDSHTNNIDHVVVSGEVFYWRTDGHDRYVPYMTHDIIPANTEFWTRDYNTNTYISQGTYTTDHYVQPNEDYYFKTPTSANNVYYKNMGRMYIQMTNNSLLSDGQEFYTLSYERYQEGDILFFGMIYYTWNDIKKTYIQHTASGIHTITASDEYYYATYTANTVKFVSTIFDYKNSINTTEAFYKKNESGSKQFIAYSKNDKMKHPYYVSTMNGNESIIPPGKDLVNFETLDENKDLTKTFGVHFYNKPLSSDLKFIFSYINGVPAYPKIAMGEHNIYGIIYKFTCTSYNIERYTDDLEVLPDCMVYGTSQYDSQVKFYRCDVLASDNKTVGDIKTENGFNELYNDFLTQINPNTVSHTAYLYKGDIMFKHNQNITPEPGPTITTYECTMDTIKTKRTLYSYVNNIANVTYFKPKTNSTIKELNCTEFVRTNVNENVTYYYYIPEGVDANVPVSTSSTAPTGSGFTQYTSSTPKIYPGWDYYTYEQIGTSGTYTFMVHSVSSETILPAGDYYYYSANNWFAKRGANEIDFIYNNGLYFENNILVNVNDITPCRYTGSPHDDNQVDLTEDTVTGYYKYKHYIMYSVGSIIPAHTVYYVFDGSGYVAKTSRVIIHVLPGDEYYKSIDVTYYGKVTNMGEILTTWKPVDISMPGFMCGYMLNGNPNLGTGTGENIVHYNTNDVIDWDKSNLVATLNEKALTLYTVSGPSPYFGSPDVHKNINVERLLVTKYATGDNPTYGKFSLLNMALYPYQYVEVPLVDEDLIYTDGYGEEYRISIKGTTAVMFDNPNINQINEGSTLEECAKNKRADDYLKYRTFYISDDGYTRHQSTYYLFDLDYTEYPLYYYNDPNNPNAELNSNLKYDVDNGAYYFNTMPDLFKNLVNNNIDATNCISISKSTQFNLSNYLRKKYNQQDDQSDEDIPVGIRYPMDKFFVVACCDNYYSISPVLETQKIRIVYNYNGFDNRKGDPIYITAQTARSYSSDKSIYRRFNVGEIIYTGDIYYTYDSTSQKYEKHTNKNANITVQSHDNYYYRVRPMLEGFHYVEDFYYLMHYRFTVHVALYQLENFAYEDDMFSQVYSRAEGSAEYCYIRVDDYDATLGHPIVNWGTALKINMSSLGTDAQDYSPGKINPWLQIMIEDASNGIRRTIGQASGEDPSRGVIVTEFNTYEDMMADYNSRSLGEKFFSV